MEFRRVQKIYYASGARCWPVAAGRAKRRADDVRESSGQARYAQALRSQGRSYSILSRDNRIECGTLWPKDSSKVQLYNSGDIRSGD